MIIDFRLRPATRGFLNMHIFRNQERIASWSGRLGMVPPPSAKQGDMELMLKEMEEGGVTLGIVPGRQANAFMVTCPTRTSPPSSRITRKNSSASPGSIRRTAPRRWRRSSVSW